MYWTLELASKLEDAPDYPTKSDFFSEEDDMVGFNKYFG